MSICLSEQGEFFTVGKFQQSPSSMPPLSLPMSLPTALPTALPRAHEPMLLLAVSESVANSATFTYFMAGALHKRISSDMVGTQGQLQPWLWGLMAPLGCH